MKLFNGWLACCVLSAFLACHKGSDQSSVPPPVPASLSFTALTVNGVYSGFTYNLNSAPVIKFTFSSAVDRNSVVPAVSLNDNSGNPQSLSISFERNDSTVVLQPSFSLPPISQYALAITTALRSKGGGPLQSAISLKLVTAIDSTDKFPRISDDQLLDLVQQQTLKYFRDFAHPVSGMARERNSSGDVVTTGGTGFGIMALLAAANRNFITRADALARIFRIVSFITTKCVSYHGAYAHWINGSTGATVPFSARDDGADLVETSYLLEGLLCARQYFNTTDTVEAALRGQINVIWNGVQWNWFRKNGENTLYWHWSPTNQWAMNMPVSGWNEALIAYVLAASSTTDSITQVVYNNGWARNGAIRNGNTFYGIQLPLGPSNGGPLFFAHYSFLGIDPNGLTDVYADYKAQNTAHTLINYNYCKANPLNYNGYSSMCWGLTASDDNATGYSAHAPGNDPGVISPTAALSSMPYTPVESMNALRFFYYKLGDKLWGDYGFRDAFNLTNVWFASSYLAIDQGPVIVMIENYRSGLLWNLFMSCPEIKRGMKQLDFQSPRL